jgi:redox-regulated HSP33 family molecular chaperone
LGLTETRSENIDENLDNYFRQSAQIATSTGIVIEMEGHRVVHACGMLVQIIGGASNADVETVLAADKNKLRSLAVKFDADFGKNLVGVDFKKIEERELSTFCSCSQEKIEDAMKMSEPGENEPATLEAVCDFCRTRYVLETAKIWP